MIWVPKSLCVIVSEHTHAPKVRGANATAIQMRRKGLRLTIKTQDSTRPFGWLKRKPPWESRRNWLGGGRFFVFCFLLFCFLWFCFRFLFSVSDYVSVFWFLFSVWGENWVVLCIVQVRSSVVHFWICFFSFVLNVFWLLTDRWGACGLPPPPSSPRGSAPRSPLATMLSMTHKWSPNDAQIIPQWYPNDIQMMSKWYLNHV